MRLWIVTKAPVDLGDAYAVVGVFTHQVLATNAVARGGAGRYLMAAVDHDRAYRDGELLNVTVVEKMTVGR